MALLAIFFCLLVAYGSPTLAVVQTDYNGQPEQRTGEMERVVAIRYTSLKVLGGCGVLVSPSAVLTAKHAVTDWPINQLTIDRGDNNKPSPPITKITKHPDNKIDLAVIHLDAKLDIKPTRWLEHEPNLGERVWFGGYGIYGKPGTNRGFGKFHTGFNHITSLRNGRATIKLTKEPTPTALPACFDSGSPVWIETKAGWALSGITVTATGREAPNIGDRSSHQLVAPVLAWLREQLAQPR